MKYYYPYTDKEDNFHDYKWKASEEYQHAVCWECNGISVEHSGKSFDIVVRREPKIFDPPHPGAEIIPLKYAVFLKEHDPQNRIIWGKVLIGKKRIISDEYVTAYMPSSNTFHARGNKKSIYNMCHLCGSRSSSMSENGEEYLIKTFCDYSVFFLGDDLALFSQSH